MRELRQAKKTQENILVTIAIERTGKRRIRGWQSRVRGVEALNGRGRSIEADSRFKSERAHRNS